MKKKLFDYIYRQLTNKIEPARALNFKKLGDLTKINYMLYIYFNYYFDAELSH